MSGELGTKEWKSKTLCHSELVSGSIQKILKLATPPKLQQINKVKIH